MKVDCHTHWGRAWRDRDGDDPSKWLAILDRHGVSHAVVLPEIGLVDAGRQPDDHDHIAAVCSGSGGRMLPFCTANPWFADEAVAEVRRCLGGMGFRGIKFHPWLQGCSVALPAMDAICEIAADAGVPILFHDGTPPFSLPSQIALLARRHPRTRIILGHCGLLEHWREAAASLNACENLWGCLCGPHVAAMRHVVQRCDRERLLWGTDHGFGLADVHAYRLPVMYELGLGETDLERVFAANPARLFSLDR